MPEVTTVHPILESGERGMPTQRSLVNAQVIVAENNYDVVLNFCGFIRPRDLTRSKRHVINSYVPFAVYVLRAWSKHPEPRHVSYMLRGFLEEVLSEAGHLH